MTHKITSGTVEHNFDQILDRALEHRDRFIVERNGEPAVLILSVSDFLESMVPVPPALKDVQEHAARLGLNSMTMDEIDAEIAAARRERPEKQQSPGR